MLNETPAKHRDIFRLVKKKSGGGEIRSHNLIIDRRMRYQLSLRYQLTEGNQYMEIMNIWQNMEKQAGNGPSRRHI